MPAIYFHGSYNSYGEHSNSAWYKTLFFNRVTTISYTLSTTMNKSLHAMLIKICNQWRWPLLLLPLLKHTIHHLSVLTFTVGLYKCSASIDECQWVPLFLHEVIQWSIFASMSDTLLSDCPSAAICHTATKCNGILERRFHLYCHIISIWRWYHGLRW